MNHTKEGRPLTLRHLRIFTEVFRTQSVTAAARNLHLTQPAVTRAVQEMERHYGLPLFERIRRRLSPTAEARRMFPQANHILEAFDRMEEELRDREDQGLVRVGATVTLGGTLLPGLVQRFRQENPNVEVRVTVANGDAVAAALEENRLDLALLEGRVSDRNLHCEGIGRDHLCLVLPLSHPLASGAEVTVEELAALPLLVREPGSTARALLEETLQAHGFALDPVWESTDTASLLQGVLHGLGAAVLPEQTVTAAVRQGLVCTRPVSGASFERRRVLAWHRDKYLTGSMQRFITLCQTER